MLDWEADLVEVTEGTTSFRVPNSNHTKGPKAREGVPFYNPAMRMARDFSVLVLQVVRNEYAGRFQVCDAMASLGARGLRFAHEVPNVHVLLNDVDPEAMYVARKNAERLHLTNVDFRIGRLEPLLADDRFHWVDLDPFGSPAPFLDVAVGAVHDGGILAVTATDKAALCGVYPETCLRRYNAQPLHGPVMWEVATRLLLAAVARAAGRRDRWIEPVLAHTSSHYLRVYARLHDGAQDSDRQARDYAYAWVKPDLSRGLAPLPPPHTEWGGPLWSGPLTDPRLLAAMGDRLPPESPRDLQRHLRMLREESASPPLYYTVDEFTRSAKVNAPRLERLLGRLRERGHRATRTHFTPRGFKTDAPVATIRDALRT